MTSLPTSNRSRIRRVPERARYDRTVIHEILDAGLVCHVGIVQGEGVFVLPLAYVRIEGSIFVHGSTGSRLLRLLAQGAQTCVTITHVDGLVLARSAFHHSLNYRSAIIFGKAKAVPPERKLAVLDALMDHLAPGRKHEVRPASEAELIQTLVVEIPIEEASAKVRSGPPKDDSQDMSLRVWAGVLPLKLVPGKPVADSDAPIPDYLLEERPWS